MAPPCGSAVPLDAVDNIYSLALNKSKFKSLGESRQPSVRQRAGAWRPSVRRLPVPNPHSCEPTAAATARPLHAALLKPGLLLAIALASGSIASPALAGREASTKLVNCGKDACLQVSGYRANPNSTVHINGNAVSVQGEHSWRVQLPLETVREWSAPFARTIEISVQGRQAESDASISAALPIGLLGGTTDLETLEIRAI